MYTLILLEYKPILDPRSAIGVLVQRPESRLSGVVKVMATHRTPSMVNIARDGDVLVGDKLITSGYGGIYPKGDCLLVMCSPSKMITEGFVKNAVEVTPSVDFYRFRRGVCATSSSVSAPKPGLEPKLVPQTQRDQVKGQRGPLNHDASSFSTLWILIYFIQAQCIACHFHTNWLPILTIIVHGYTI